MDHVSNFKKRKNNKVRLAIVVTGLAMFLPLFFISLSKSEITKKLATIDHPITSSHETNKSGGNNDTVMSYIYNAPESENDNRYEYHWEILRTALEKTKNKYGAYVMTRAATMTEKRQFYELLNDSKNLTVMFLDTKPEHEKNLLPIHIPVDKNLCGYRLFLIRKDEQEKFNKIKKLDDLKKTVIGLGNDWIDVDILRSNNFSVMTGSSYEGLFKMLVNCRFDAFSRSAVEVLDEFEKRKVELKNVKIEDSLLLYYPLPMYFWFSKKEKGKLLAKRAQEGMELMLDDGTYDRIFLKYHGSKTEKLHLKKRRVFRISNPYLVAETPFKNKKLWYNPIDN